MSSQPNLLLQSYLSMQKPWIHSYIDLLSTPMVFESCWLEKNPYLESGAIGSHFVKEASRLTLVKL